MSSVPIRIRVAVAFAVAMAVVLASTGWFLYTSLEDDLSRSLNRELIRRADDLELIVIDPADSLAAMRTTTNATLEHGETYAQLLDPAGRVQDATTPVHDHALLSADEVHQAIRGAIFLDRSSTPGLDEPSRLYATPVQVGGRPAVLVVGATTENRAETLAGLRAELLIAGPIALLLASVAGYVLAGLSLKPVDSMRRRADMISAETPGERLPVPHTRDEVERLGRTLNAMLERLEQGLERERGFVADAGHELRTPLALLRTELELALRHAASADALRHAVRRSSVEVDRLALLAEDLLLLARSSGGSLPLRLETLVIGDILSAAASRFEWRAREEGRDLKVVEAGDQEVRGDWLRVEQALSNAVDNALRYGGGTVELSAVRARDHVELHVTDEGDGFPAGFLMSAFDRFSRADQVRTGRGAGLGLSIVRAIAEAHGGTAHVRNREAGGADVWISLPDADAAVL